MAQRTRSNSVPETRVRLRLVKKHPWDTHAQYVQQASFIICLLTHSNWPNEAEAARPDAKEAALLRLMADEHRHRAAASICGGSALVTAGYISPSQVK